MNKFLLLLNVIYCILVKSVAENRTDITVPGFVITEERHKLVDFSVPFFSQGLYIWIKKPEVKK